MDKAKIRTIFEDLGLDEQLVDLPIVYDAIENARAVRGNTENIAEFIKVITPTRFSIASVSFDVRDDGTIKVERAGFSGHYIANKLGIEVEHVREKTAEGVKKVVRRDGQLKEVWVTDQGETEVGTSKLLDNGNPVFHHAYGGTDVRRLGKPIYFDPNEVLLDFDRNTRTLQYGTVGQQRYRREARIQLELAMREEKIYRLPLKEQVEALRELKNDLAREYKHLCDLIELDLAEHRTDLEFIRKISKFPKIKEDFAEKLQDYRARVAKQRVGPNEDGEIYPRILEYRYADSPEDANDLQLQTERNNLEEKIYEYKKRNAELRARRDRTTEMVSAMNPLYNAVADEHHQKGFVVGILFNRILERYKKDSAKIQQAKEEKCERYRRDTVSIQNARKDREEKRKFDARRKTVTPETAKGTDKKIEEEITPKPAGKGLDDGDNDQK